MCTNFEQKMKNSELPGETGSPLWKFGQNRQGEQAENGEKGQFFSAGVKLSSTSFSMARVSAVVPSPQPESGEAESR